MCIAYIGLQPDQIVSFTGATNVSTAAGSSSQSDIRPGRLSAGDYARAFGDATPRLTVTQALLEAELFGVDGMGLPNQH